MSTQGKGARLILPGGSSGGWWPMVYRRGIVFLCAGLLVLVAQAAPRFYATLDRDTIALGESATLSLVFEGGSPKAAPLLPNMPGLITQHTGQNSQWSSVNGQMTSSLTFNYQVVPQKVGDFVIPAFSIDIDGQTRGSQPLKLKVVPAAQASAAQRNALNQLVSARLVVPRTNLVVGETVPAQIHIYFLTSGRVGQPQLPAEGFTLGKITGPGQTKSQIGNRMYEVMVYTLPITPVRTGQLTLGPAQCQVEVTIPQRAGRRNFEDLFNLPNPFGEVRQVTVTTDPVTLQVDSLPTNNVPADFTGAVGQFQLNVTVSPTNVSVGDPITLRIQLSGRGQLDALTLPTSPAWSDFKLYPPTRKVENTDPLGVEGMNTIEQVITPQNTNVKAVPAIHFSFYDPEQKKFQQLQHPPTPITVSPVSPVALTRAPLSVSNPSSPAADLVHIRSRLTAPIGTLTPWFERPWFWGLSLVPLLIWLSALIYRQMQDRLLADPHLRRQREADRAIREGVKLLRHFSATSQPEAFYATLFRILQEEVGAYLNVPASSITAAVIEEQLQPAGLDEAILRELGELFQVCDQARYAPTQMAAETAALLPRLEAWLRSFKALRRPPPSALARAAASRSALWGICLIPLLASVGQGAVTIESRFQEANRLYEEGQYQEAAGVYQQLLRQGVLSDTLFFNLGNAYYKNGQIGRARACYWIARELSPRARDVRSNLRFLAQAAGPEPGGRWLRLVARLRFFNLNEWTLLVSAGLWLWLALLAAAHWQPAWRTRLRPFCLAMVGFLIVAGAGFLLTLQDRYGTARAVVIAPETAVRRGPLPESQAVGQLPDGAMVQVTDQQNEWLLVVDTAGRTGWLPDREVVRLRPGLLATNLF